MNTSERYTLLFKGLPEEITVYSQWSSFQDNGGARDQIRAFVLLLHGAGQSLHTWRPLLNSIAILSVSPVLHNFVYICIDFRSHGKTTSKNEKDMSLERLAKDTVEFIQSWLQEKDSSCKLFLVGHSLGGSVATKVSSLLSDSPSVNNFLAGLVVIDMVEGTAKDAIGYSQAFFRNRPRSFESVSSAIDWHLSHRILHSRTSALVTVPQLFVEKNDYEGNKRLYWRTDMPGSFEHWSSWFDGLSKMFLGLKRSIGKVLVLADRSKLDSELLVGQMQGKFQLVLLDNEHVGHFIHEDDPDQVALEILNFLSRQFIVSVGLNKGRSAEEVMNLRKNLYG